MIYSGGIMQDVVSLSLESTQNRVYTVTIDCFDGHELSLGTAVTDLTVEAKHSAAGSYTDIETTAIDLSTWAGTTQTFNIRLTAGTITSHLIRSFRIRVGPASVIPNNALTFGGAYLKFGGNYLVFNPAAVTYYITFGGDKLTMNGDYLTFNP